MRQRAIWPRRPPGAVRAAGLAFVAVAALGACSGSGHANGAPAPAPSTTSVRVPVSHATTAPRGPAASTPAPASGAIRADLASLKQQLDATGTDLGAAGSALAQADPNQTKNEEGTAP